VGAGEGEGGAEVGEFGVKASADVAVLFEIEFDGLENVFAHFGAGEELGGGGGKVEAELDGAGG
jgi:hypothetical protein